MTEREVPGTNAAKMYPALSRPPADPHSGFEPLEQVVWGIDLIRFNEQGKVVEFAVMIRPLSGLPALGEAMERRLAPYLQANEGA